MYSYVTRFYSYVLHIYSYINRIILVLYSYYLVCYSYVLEWCFSHDLSRLRTYITQCAAAQGSCFRVLATTVIRDVVAKNSPTLRYLQPRRLTMDDRSFIVR